MDSQQGSQQGSQSEDEAHQHSQQGSQLVSLTTSAHQGTQLVAHQGTQLVSTSASDNLIDHNFIDADTHHERVDAIGNIVFIRGMIEEIGQVQLVSSSWSLTVPRNKFTEQIWVDIEALNAQAACFASKLENILHQHYGAPSAISADHYDTEFDEVMDKYNELKGVCAHIVFAQPRGLKRSASDP